MNNVIIMFIPKGILIDNCATCADLGDIEDACYAVFNLDTGIQDFSYCARHASNLMKEFHAWREVSGRLVQM